MVKLIPMAEEDYGPYLERTIREYAEEKVKSGDWQEAESLEKSRKEFEHYKAFELYSGMPWRG